MQRVGNRYCKMSEDYLNSISRRSMNLTGIKMRTNRVDLKQHRKKEALGVGGRIEPVKFTRVWILLNVCSQIISRATTCLRDTFCILVICTIMLIYMYNHTFTIIHMYICTIIHICTIINMELHFNLRYLLHYLYLDRLQSHDVKASGFIGFTHAIPAHSEILQNQPVEYKSTLM